MIVSKEFKIGAVFFIAVAIFLFFAVAVGTLPVGSKVVMVVYFDKVYGLQPGNDVWVNGNSFGSVKSIENVIADGTTKDGKAVKMGKVKVTLNLNEKLVLHEGYTIKVVDKSLIAGRAVEIDPGPPDAPVVTGDLIGRSTDTLASLQVRLGNALDEMMTAEGTFRQLVLNKDFYNKTLALLDSAGGTLARVNKTIDMFTAKGGAYETLAGNKKLADDIVASVAEIKNTAAQLDEFTKKMNEPGSLPSSLAADKTLYPRLQEIAKNLNELTKKLNEGKGVTRLLTDDTIYDNIRDTTYKINETARVAEKLVKELDKDPQMLIAGRPGPNESWLAQQLRGPNPAPPPAPAADSRKLVPNE